MKTFLPEYCSRIRETSKKRYVHHTNYLLIAKNDFLKILSQKVTDIHVSKCKIWKVTDLYNQRLTTKVVR